MLYQLQRFHPEVCCGGVGRKGSGEGGSMGGGYVESGNMGPWDECVVGVVRGWEMSVRWEW